MSTHELKCWKICNFIYSSWIHLIFVSHFFPHPVHSLLKSAFNSIAIEKEKLKQMVSEQDHNKGHSTQMARLRQSLSQVKENVCFTLMAHTRSWKVKYWGGGGPSCMACSTETTPLKTLQCRDYIFKFFKN